MGLDLYVGSLNRYYSGDWQLSVERFAEELGASFSILGPHPTKPGDGEEPSEARASVLRWKADLIARHGRQFPDGLDWDESPRAPYFTEKPGWDGFDGLRIWAAYLEHPDLTRPRKYPRDDWKDPAVTRSEERTRFPHLIPFVGIWLPSPMDRPFRAEDVGGQETVIGSSAGLLAELETVNAESWKLDLRTYGGEVDDSWYEAGPLEHHARWGFAAVFKLVKEAQRHRLPMVKDY